MALLIAFGPAYHSRPNAAHWKLDRRRDDRCTELIGQRGHISGQGAKSEHKKGSQLLPALALFRLYFSLCNLRYQVVESVRH
jgi:hypothetical protein